MLSKTYLNDFESLVVSENTAIFVCLDNSVALNSKIILKENVHLNLHIWMFSKKTERINLNIQTIQKEKSVLNIYSYQIGQQKSYQELVVDSLIEAGSVNQKQKQVVFDEARLISSPILRAKSENVVANHGLTSGFNLINEDFFLGLRGLNKQERRKILWNIYLETQKAPEEISTKINQYIEGIHYEL